MGSERHRRSWPQALLKPLIWLLCLAPAVYLLLQILSDALGANPVEALIRATGDWTLRGLCLVLALTPMQVSLGWSVLARVRRLLGLFTFFYAGLHVLTYAWLEMAWSWRDMGEDVLQRWFIVVGVGAFFVLLSLAISSHHAVLRSLGGKNWKRLHQSVHVAAWLALLHFFWMRSGKSDFAEVAVYAAIIAFLQAWRVVRRIRNNRRKTRAQNA